MNSFSKKALRVNFFKYSLALLMLVMCGNVNAEPWKIEVAPYLWAINMNGRVQTGPLTSHISEDFGDILKQFKGGGMLWIDASKDKYGIFFNALYTVLSESTEEGPFTIDSKNKFGIFSVGASYQIYKIVCDCDAQVTVEPYLGLRYTLNNVTLKVDGTPISVSDNQHWMDPILGMRVRYNINKYWLALFAGDVGGTNLNDHNSYNLIALLGYKPESLKNTTFYLGYRLLYQHYETGSGSNLFSWQMKLFGPALGFSIVF